MHNFDSLKGMWQQTSATSNTTRVPPMQGSKTASVRLKLQREQARGAIMLVLTAIIIVCVALFTNLKFQHLYTYVAMYMVALICLLQAGVSLFTYQKLKAINDTAPPAEHLQQWEAYYAFRKGQTRWNMPVYFTVLNVAMGVYLLEVLSGRPIVYVSIYLVLYTGWMLFAIFYLGKRSLKREKHRLQLIIDELKMIAQQIEEGI